MRTAVGFVESDARKDTIKVVEMPFPAPAELPKAPMWKSMPFNVLDIIKGVVAVVLLLVIFKTSRKVIANMSVESEAAGMPVGGLRASGGSLAGGGAAELEPTLDDVMRMAEQNPRAIAAWITNVSGHR